MIHQLNQLDQGEKDLLLDMIPMITILIGGADGQLDSDEVNESERITKVRAYVNSDKLSDYYNMVGERFNSRLRELINELPRDTDSRTAELSEEIAKISPVLSKMRDDQAELFLKSWRTFAKHVAKSSGGFLSYLTESAEELALVDLPMIDFEPGI